ADPRGAGRRPAGRLPPGRSAQYQDGLRGPGRRQGYARPWRHRGVRRHGRYGRAGALRDGVLRRRKLRQVHALPHRLDPRRRGDRPDHRRREPREEPDAARRSLRNDGGWIALRPRRTDAVPGAKRDPPLPRGFRQAQSCSIRAQGRRVGTARKVPMNAPVTNPVIAPEPLTLVKEKDFGTPERQAEKQVSLEIDGIAVTVPQGTS